MKSSDLTPEQLMQLPRRESIQLVRLNYIAE